MDQEQQNGKRIYHSPELIEYGALSESDDSCFDSRIDPANVGEDDGGV